MVHDTVRIILRNILCLAALLVLFGLARPVVAKSFVYVTNYGDGTISQFRVRPNGALTPLGPPTVKAWPRCHSLAVTQGRFLYALSSLEFSRRDCLVSQFRIGSDGVLAPLAPPTVPVSSVDSRPSLVRVDPAGRFAYVMGSGSKDTIFRVEADGRLTVLTPIYFANEGIGRANVQVVFHPSRPLLYESLQSSPIGPGEETTGSIQVLPILPGGLPGDKPIQMLDQSADTPLGVFLARQGQYAYVPHNWGRRPDISQYRISPDGRLTPLQPARVALSGSADIPLAVVDPRSRLFDLVVRDIVGQFGYEYPAKRSRLVRFTVGTDGRLRQRRTQFLPVQGAIADALFDPSGHFLYLLTGNGIRPFRVKSDGSVTALLPRSIRAGREPLGMVYVQH